jgi:hypothetical protein
MSEQPTGADLSGIVAQAVSCAFDTYDIGDNGWLIDLLCGRIQNIIANDKRFPKLTNLEFDLLIADVRREALHVCDYRASLDYRHATRAIVEDVLNELQPQQEQVA